MITSAKWDEIASKSNPNLYSGNAQEMTYDKCLEKTRDYITERSADWFNDSSVDLGTEERIKAIKGYITEFVSKNKPIVSGFIDAKGTMLFEKLSMHLVDSITNWGVLTDARNDESITEIRINGVRSIFVEKNGISQQLRDPYEDKLVVFNNASEVFQFANKLLQFSKAQISENDTKAMANGITIEGYRVAVTGPSVTAANKSYKGMPEDSKCPNIVIRKFAESTMTAKDFVDNKTMSYQMAVYLHLLVQSEMSLAIIGPTGSGKTTILQMLLDQIPNTRRIMSIEDPSELRIRHYNNDGSMRNDVVQWEAKDFTSNNLTQKTTFPTYENEMVQSLRMSPAFFCFGELRRATVFNLALQAASTGHFFYTTYHSGNAVGALLRYANAVQQVNPGMGHGEILQSVCSYIKFIICERKMTDGHRKVLSITEVLGTKLENGIIIPNVNEIFRFVPDRVDPKTRETIGHHEQVGTISNSFSDNFKYAGLLDEERAILTQKATLENPIIGDYNWIDFDGGKEESK